jgi:hypothetical protein
MSTNQKFTHKLIAATAREFAGAFYEEAASGSDDFFKYYPNQRMFVRREWKRFVEVARKQLAAMLGFSTTPEWQKEEIFEALVRHSEIPGNIDKRVADQIMGVTKQPELVVH